MTFKEMLAKRQKEVDAIVLNDPEQISTLPWLGNHACDDCLFNKIDLFVKSLTNKEQQRRALYLMGLYGMGVDEPVSDEEIDQTLEH